MELRERVIKGLEHELQNRGKCGHYCRDGIETVSCEYDKDGLCIQHWGNDALALLKAQEPPTSELISSAIECLLHPQDADDSDMAKAIGTAVRAMRLLKAQEPILVEERADTDTINCPKCGQQFARVGHDKSIYLDTDEEPNCCPKCGRAVKWDGN